MLFVDIRHCSRSRYFIHNLHIMKKKIIDIFIEVVHYIVIKLIRVIQFIAVTVCVFLILAIMCAIAIWSYNMNNHPQESTRDQKELNEMVVHHADKGSIEVEDGLIIIKPY